jgi:peptidoglycan/LPS O-acetylase OafA/YrhL
LAQPLWAPALAPITPQLLAEFLTLAPFFFAGAALYVLRGQIPLHWVVAVSAAGLLVLGLALDVARYGLAPAVAYLMLWLGARLPLTWLARRNDLSYGVYIYGFPCEQLLALAGVPDAVGIIGYIAASTVLTQCCAAASWWLVEKPSRRWRHLLDPRQPRLFQTGLHRTPLRSV